MLKDVNFPVFLKLAKKQNRIFLSKNSSNWREMSATFTISDFDRFEFCPLFLKYTKLAKKQIFWWFLHKAEIGIELMTLCASCGTTMNVEMIHWKMNINSAALKKDALKPFALMALWKGQFYKLVSRFHRWHLQMTSVPPMAKHIPPGSLTLIYLSVIYSAISKRRCARRSSLTSF